jgi:hypothetical protein
LNSTSGGEWLAGAARSVRFNLLPGLSATPHNMQQLTHEMHTMARQRRVVVAPGGERPVVGSPAVPPCIVAEVPKI